MTREQRLRRRVEDLARDLGFDGIVTLSLTDPGQPAALRIGADDPRAQPIGISNPLSSEHSVLRTTLLGGLLDVARYNLSHGARRVSLYESGRAYLRDGEPIGDSTLGGRFPGWRAAPAFEPWRIGCLVSGPAPGGGWRGEPVEPDFYALKGTLEGIAAGIGCALEVEPATEPFLSPGRSARVIVDGAAAGWVGEIHPLVCRTWDLDAAAGFEVDLAVLADASPVGAEQYEDVITYPAIEQDIAVIVDEDVGGGARARGRRRGGRRVAAVDRRSSTCTAASSRRGPQEPRPAAGVPRRRPDAHRRRGRRDPRADRGVAREDRGVAACLTAPSTGCGRRRVRLRRGALGGAGLGHPRLELAAATSRSRCWDAAQPASTRATGCPIELTELDLALLEDVDSAIVSYPHGAAAPVVAEMRGLGLPVVDLSADFRLVDAAIYERWYAPHGEPELLENAVYGLTELDRDPIRTPSSSPTPAAIRPPRSWRSRRSPSGR